MTPLDDSRKAMSLFRKYIRMTEQEERPALCMAMPTKLPVKLYNGSYRTKLIPDTVQCQLHDAYFSKRDDLIAVFSVITPESELGSDLSSAQYIEIPSKLLSARLSTESFTALMTHIGHTTDGEMSASDAYATPASSAEYDVNEAFGSWS